MAAFAFEDALLKLTSVQLPLGQILIIFGLGGVVFFAAVSFIRDEPLYTPDVISQPMRWRVLFEVIGRLFFILAITLTPLSSATAILQATPIVVVAGAALFFGEKVGWRRWAAIVIGLIGVLFIIRPGTASFSPLSMLAVIGVFGLAGRDLASRAAPANLSFLLLGLYGFMSVIVAGILYAVFDASAFVWPTLTTSLYLSGTIAFGVIAYTALMVAMRTGEVSSVTPFRYSRLLFGIMLGVLLFNEQLDLPMLVGCLMIVLAGLFILWRSKPVQE